MKPDKKPISINEFQQLLDRTSMRKIERGDVVRAVTSTSAPYDRAGRSGAHEWERGDIGLVEDVETIHNHAIPGAPNALHVTYKVRLLRTGELMSVPAYRIALMWLKVVIEPEVAND